MKGVASNPSSKASKSWVLEKLDSILKVHKYAYNFCIEYHTRRLLQQLLRLCTSWRWTPWLGEKNQNAIFLEIFQNPFNRLLQWVQNLTNFFLFLISQQVWLLEASKVLAWWLSNGQNFFFKFAQTWDEQMLKISSRYLDSCLI